jgi:hypothetical protein
MKSLVLSHQASNGLSENFLSFRERDDLFEQLHSSLESFSYTNIAKTEQIALKIDALKIVLDIEIHPTIILILQVHVLDEWC